jgi:hypothetical protein
MYVCAGGRERGRKNSELYSILHKSLCNTAVKFAPKKTSLPRGDSVRL